MSIDRIDRADETITRAIPHFDKHEHVAVEHDQVDFAVPAVKVPADWPQALIYEVAESELLGVGAAFPPG